MLASKKERTRTASNQHGLTYRANGEKGESMDIVGSGELFHAAPTAEEQYNLMVRPLVLEDNEPNEYADSTLRKLKKDQLIEYIRYLKRRINRDKSLLEKQASVYKSLMKEKCEKCMMERD